MGKRAVSASTLEMNPSQHEPTTAATQARPPNDSRLDETDSVLLVVTPTVGAETLCQDFFGTVIFNQLLLPTLTHKSLYLCGDISEVTHLDIAKARHIYIIRELSQNYDDARWSSCSLVGVGRVPINTHGVGVFYRRFFDPQLDLFNKIRSDHMFQALTESNKPGTAHRTGIYLTPVEEQGNGDLHFRLLRCSSNLSGPTGNFRENDTHIVDTLNQEASCIFKNQAPLNHVLAQIYRNTPGDGYGKRGIKDKKAKIKEHSDKTKDMPDNGLMAFVTFYDADGLNELTPLANDPFDYGIGGTSALTKLVFRLKPCVLERLPGCELPRQFSLTLYPQSVFFMPLSTNRLYTHEIRPSSLEARLLPTRMGYVVRCSDAEAIHRDGNTYLQTKDQTSTNSTSLVKLVPPTLEGMAELRHLYAEENRYDNVIDYGEVLFSMNKGDYMRPLVYNHEKDDFTSFMVPSISSADNLFDELASSISFEYAGKGRLGAVLVKGDATRGTPIVRTTTQYTSPAFCFQSIHSELAQHIQNLIISSSSTSIPLFDFNNALIEKYTNSYTTMGFHSDQALDLAEGSCIAVFSCYKYPDQRQGSSRKLVIESKDPNGGQSFEVPLRHHSVVVFSVDTNKLFKHKIVLDHSAEPCQDQEWLGITFRTSKTFVQYKEGKVGELSVYFEDGSPLNVADEKQRKAFYKLRREENEQTDFVYPTVAYTISDSDVLLPT